MPPSVLVILEDDKEEQHDQQQQQQQQQRNKKEVVKVVGRKTRGRGTTNKRRTIQQFAMMIAFILAYLHLFSNHRRLLPFMVVLLKENYAPAAEKDSAATNLHHQQGKTTTTATASRINNDRTTSNDLLEEQEQEQQRKQERTTKGQQEYLPILNTRQSITSSTTTNSNRSSSSSNNYHDASAPSHTNKSFVSYSSTAVHVNLHDHFSSSANKEKNEDDFVTVGKFPKSESDIVITLMPTNAQQNDHSSVNATTTTTTVATNGTNTSSNSNVTSTKSITSYNTFQNSKKWLDGPRFSNIVESRMTHDFVASLILDASPLMSDNGSEHLLEHSICPSGSNFLKWQELPALGAKRGLRDDENESRNASDISSSSTRNIESLTMRLMYLAIHEHQHQPARAEAKARWLENQVHNSMDLDHPPNSILLSNVQQQQKKQQQKKIEPFDFECDHDTKYIIAGIPSKRGFGSNFRSYGVEPIMLGIIMNRVALYMNSLRLGPKILQTKFLYSKCPRKDMQCMFMPLSPCVVTHEDIAKAVVLPREELIKFRRTGILDEMYAKEKVLVVETANLHVIPKGFHDAIIEKIAGLYNRKNRNNDEAVNSNTSRIKHQHPAWELSDELMNKVKQFIFDPKNKWSMWYPAAMYGMRPNAFLKGELDRILSNVIPNDFNPATAIGIPIRDGDKCIKETRCLSFEQYMKLAVEMAAKRTRQRNVLKKIGEEKENATASSQKENLYDTILLSCDNKNITQQRFNYAKNESFPFTIIANDEDIGQGHGIPPFYRNDADSIMVSSMAALKMQLLPDTLVYNGCSNFHKLIVNFYSGCGRSEVGYYESLKDNDNHEFRMRCHW